MAKGCPRTQELSGGSAGVAPAEPPDKVRDQANAEATKKGQVKTLDNADGNGEIHGFIRL